MPSHRWPATRTLLLIVGDGPQREALEAQVAALGLASRVRFAGNQQDVRPWLHSMDVFALPSYANEGVPQALLQAMLCGLPCVTHRTSAASARSRRTERPRWWCRHRTLRRSPRHWRACSATRPCAGNSARPRERIARADSASRPCSTRWKRCFAMSSRLQGRVETVARAIFARVATLGRRQPPAQPKRILVAHHLFLGDTLMLTPLLAKIRQRWPDADLAMTVPAAFLPLYATRPYGVRALSVRAEGSRNAARAVARAGIRSGDRAGRQPFQLARRGYGCTLDRRLRRRSSGVQELAGGRAA